MSDKILDIDGLGIALASLTGLSDASRKKCIEILRLSQDSFLKKFPEIRPKLQRLTKEALRAINERDDASLIEIAQGLSTFDGDLALQMSPFVSISKEEGEALQFLAETRAIWSDKRNARVHLPWINAVSRMLMCHAVERKTRDILRASAHVSRFADKLVVAHVDNAKDYREGWANSVYRELYKGVRRRDSERNRPRMIVNSSSPGILDYGYEMKTRGRPTPGSADPAGAIDAVWQLVRNGAVRLTYYWDKEGVANYLGVLRKEHNYDNAALQQAITESMKPYLDLETVEIILVSQHPGVYSTQQGGISHVFGDYAFEYTLRTPDETKYVFTISRASSPGGLITFFGEMFKSLPAVRKYLPDRGPLAWLCAAITDQADRAIDQPGSVALKRFGEKEIPQRFFDNLTNRTA